MIFEVMLYRSGLANLPEKRNKMRSPNAEYDQDHAGRFAQFSAPMLPFGGEKESEYGRTHGQEGLMQFLRTRSYVAEG
jgi:hypothetical protein